MAKRGYKLQEFVAHAGNVNCLSFGRKNCRVFITGGDDQKVNLWSVGKPTSLMSLCGHTSPVESAAFDSAEVLVAAGSSSGAIKLWDLEETKLVRTLTGHRSYCTAVEFHPFGELFASGSMDTNLKIWDIRKKGCIQTYKGHTRGISTIRFSPDGRWVVSGGFDNVVKVWDLTAGKLLHDFKFHEGHVRSIEFHPLEFLLATGSADKTVKFWDLETFEMIGSARRESSGVRSITFHPDGRSLFCGSDDGLKVYSWEPVICHDSVDMGWSTLGDLCVHDGKLLGGAYYENSVAIWVADISLIERNGSRSAPEQLVQPEQKSSSRGSLLKKEESQDKSKSNIRPATPDSDCKEIKTIYVDRVNSITSKAVSPVDAPKVVLRRINSITSTTADPVDAPNVVVSSNSKEISTPKTVQPVDASKSVLRHLNSLTSMTDRSDSPKVVLQSDSGEISTPMAIDSVDMPKLELKRVNSINSKTSDSMVASKRELSSDSKEISSSKTVDLAVTPKAVLKRASSVKRVDSVDVSKIVHPSGSKEISTTGTQKRTPAKRNVSAGNRSLVMPSIVPRDGPSRRNSLAPAAKTSISASAKNQTRRMSDNRFDMGRMSISLDSVSSESSKSSLSSRKDFETRSRLVDDVNSRESSTEKEPSINFVVEKQDKMSSPATPSNTENGDQTLNSSKSAKPVRVVNGVTVVHGRTRSLVERFEKRESSDANENDTPVQASIVMTDSSVAADPLSSKPTIEPLVSCVTSEPITSKETAEPVGSRVNSGPDASRVTSRRLASSVASGAVASRTTAGSLSSRVTSGLESSRVTSGTMASRLASMRLSSSVNVEPFTSCVVSEPLASRTTAGFLAFQKTTEHVASRPISGHGAARVTAGHMSSRSNADPENITMNKSTSDDNIIENVMQNHDMLLSTFRSRLTKLQVVRHFWERNDVKGAINAVKKLPDRSVQADVVDIITGRMEIITLDIFSCLLPVLLGLLENKVERHATVSLEMLLKLVAVFGSTIRSTVSAPPAVGVDLHLEERRECCRQCFTHLQHVQKFLPELVKSGGGVARCAQQLNMVLQQVL